MVSLEQWRAAIGCFASSKVIKICRVLKYEDSVSHECIVCLIVYASIIGMLLIISGNIELNPRPFKKCPKCDNSVPTQLMKCTCGHVFMKCKQHNVLENKRILMRNKRACVNECESVERKLSNKLSMSRKRALETNNEAFCRRESDRLSKKHKRLCETNDEAFCRRESDRLSKKHKRLCETNDEAFCRREIVKKT